jgi:hypothetical protein
MTTLSYGDNQTSRIDRPDRQPASSAEGRPAQLPALCASDCRVLQMEESIPLIVLYTVS